MNVWKQLLFFLIRSTLLLVILGVENLNPIPDMECFVGEPWEVVFKIDEVFSPIGNVSMSIVSSVSSSLDSPLLVHSVTSEDTAEVVGSLFVSDGGCIDVSVDHSGGDLIYGACGESGVLVIDVSEKMNPRLLGTYDTDDVARGVFTYGDVVYVADDSSGLKILNTSDPTNPDLLGSCDTDGLARNVFVVDDYAYVADAGRGMKIIDVSDNENPFLIGSYNTPGVSRGIFVLDDLAFIADDANGLVIVNVSNRGDPHLAGMISIHDTYGMEVAVSNDVAYIATYIGVETIDISNISHPLSLEYFETLGYSNGIFVSGNKSYVAAEALETYDVSNPSNLTLLNSCHIPGNANRVKAQKGYAFVAGGTGIQVVSLGRFVVLSTTFCEYGNTTIDVEGCNDNNECVSDGFSVSGRRCRNESNFMLLNSAPPLCVTDCGANGPYFNDEMKDPLSCSPCELLHCDDCTSGETCTECSEDYFLIVADGVFACVSSCNHEGPYFEEYFPSRCSPCSDVNCLNCSDASSSSCVSCKSNLTSSWFLKSGACVTECGDTFLGNSENGECVQCGEYNENCEECTGRDDCLKCTGNYYLLNGKCYQDCSFAEVDILGFNFNFYENGAEKMECTFDYVSVGVFIFVICLCGVAVLAFAIAVVVAIICRFTIKLKRYSDIPDVELLIEEEKVRKKRPTPKHKMKKSLFEIDPKSVKILKRLGEGGGNAVVYLSECEGQEVAYKVFAKKDDSEKDVNIMYRDFERELEIMSSISFPYILTFRGATLSELQFGIVMEYGSNGDLSQFIQRREGTYPFERKLRLLYEVASAMAFLHKKKIMHRDLKPENVVITESERAKVMDFGVSKFNVENETMTRRVGTSIYMAPEVVRTGVYSYSCDVFSFSIVCYVVLTENWFPYGKNVCGIETKIALNRNLRPSFDGVGDFRSREGISVRQKKSVFKELHQFMKKNWENDAKKRMTFVEVREFLEKSREKYNSVIFDERGGSSSENNNVKQTIMELKKTIESMEVQERSSMQKDLEELKKSIEWTSFKDDDNEEPSKKDVTGEGEKKESTEVSVLDKEEEEG